MASDETKSLILIENGSGVPLNAEVVGELSGSQIWAGVDGNLLLSDLVT